MSLLARLKNRLGYDTERTVSSTMPLVAWTVTHTDGSQTVVVGNYDKTEGAYKQFYAYDGAVKHRGDIVIFLGEPWPSSTQLVELDDIKSVEETKIGESTLRVRYDPGRPSAVAQWTLHHQRDAELDSMDLLAIAGYRPTLRRTGRAVGVL